MTLPTAVLFLNIVQAIINGWYFANRTTPKYSLTVSYLACIAAMITTLYTSAYIPIPIFPRIVISTAFLLFVWKAVSNNSLKSFLLIVLEFSFIVLVAELTGQLILNALFTDTSAFTLPDSVNAMSLQMQFVARFCGTYVLCIPLILSIILHRYRQHKRMLILHFTLLLFFVTHFATILFALSIPANLLNEGFIASSMISLFLSFLITLIIQQFLVITTATEEQQNRIEQRLLYQDLEQEYYELAVHKEEKLSRIRHDMSNMLQTALMLFESKNPQNQAEAKEMLKKQTAALCAVAPTVYCDVPVINTVLALKKETAEQKGIHLNIEVEKLSRLYIENMDLCSILSNLLDNAILHTSSYDGQNQVGIKIAPSAGYLLIRTENPLRPGTTLTRNQLLSSSPSHTEGHGYGMEILKELTKKYDGNLDVMQEGNQLFIILLLKIL